MLCNCFVYFVVCRCRLWQYYNYWYFGETKEIGSWQDNTS
jgi:hypothetical protein